jgi:hypothetical protein
MEEIKSFYPISIVKLNLYSTSTPFITDLDPNQIYNIYSKLEAYKAPLGNQVISPYYQISKAIA